MTKQLQLIQIKLSGSLLQEMDKLVNTGLYLNRSEIIRDALRQLITKKEK